jgi:hypothetical protein
MFLNLVSMKSHQIIHSIYREIGIIFFKIYEISQIQIGKPAIRIIRCYRSVLITVKPVELADQYDEPWQQCYTWG